LIFDFFDFFYILKTLVNIFEVTKKSDSVEFFQIMLPGPGSGFSTTVCEAVSIHTVLVPGTGTAGKTNLENHTERREERLL
jgi:hypothetical protein